MMRYFVRRVLRSLAAAGLLVLTLPWLVLHQAATQDLQAELTDIVPWPLPPLSADEARASQAVLAYRACPSGPTIEQLVDDAMIGGRPGVVHFRSGSRVAGSEPDRALYHVDIVTETDDAGYFDRRRKRSEHPIGFTYDERTGRVAGRGPRDTSGERYLESARWECVRELTPWRRGPPEPVNEDA